MTRWGMHFWLMVLTTLPALPSLEQAQSCPINIDFSEANLTHWNAYTGNNKSGNGPGAIIINYDSSQPGPNGTIGTTNLPEYDLPGVSGITVVTYQSNDPFGGFQTIPTINGYTYPYSILLGSTSVAEPPPNNPAAGTGILTTAAPQGGYVRGIKYLIDVPTGPPTLPYTMTYAYAMVLENGTHASAEQPMARAIVSTPAGVITCASPEYFLPTDFGGLDSATARANGFTPSPRATPNPSRNPGDSGLYLKDVWTKGWTEVTFDLTPYRGQQVTLTFEADNCVPGGHFAYAYFALRNSCAGLRMNGDSILCANMVGQYAIPSLDSATYNWSAPPGWTVESGGNSNSFSVLAGPSPGWIVATEKNSCTTLTDSFFVNLYKGALPQASIDPADTTICYGATTPLHALVTTGTEYSWAKNEWLTERDKGVIASVPFPVNLTVAPTQTTDYILNIQNAGCPITVSDTFVVTIVPPIRLDPGNDTLVVVDEPLQFQATSSDPYKDNYQWDPSTDLSDPNTANPIGLYGPEMNTITYQVTATDTFGCYGTASVKVTIAHTMPDIFMPNAFTPGTNSNNVFRPICIGISSLDYFRVFNRWGQLMFSSSQIGQGWDGRIQGKLQESNAYLWIVKGTDYTGRAITKKGTMVLIR